MKQSIESKKALKFLTQFIPAGRNDLIDGMKSQALGVVIENAPHELDAQGYDTLMSSSGDANAFEMGYDLLVECDELSVGELQSLVSSVFDAQLKVIAGISDCLAAK